MKTSKESTKAYSVLLKSHKVPRSLIAPLTNVIKTNKLHGNFEDAFGPKSKRSKPNIEAYTMEELSSKAEKSKESYSLDKDEDYKKIFDIEKHAPETKYMNYGQSKRIYRELHKVIDSSDVVCIVLDARDPIGTRCVYIENFVKKKLSSQAYSLYS